MSETQTAHLGTLGLAAGFLAVAVALVAAGAVDERVAPLWNPALLAAAALGPAYAAPHTPLRRLFIGGVSLGLLYGGMVIGAAALRGIPVLVGPGRLLALAAAIAALPPVAAGLLYRWIERRSRRPMPPAA